MNARKRLVLPAGLLIFLTGWSLAWAGPEYFDEACGPDGQVRAPYKCVIEVYSQMSPQEKKKFGRESKKLLGGDNEISPLPRVLSAGEYEFLKRGVQQRAEAIRRFLRDHYSGQKRYLKAGVVPPEVIERVLKRNYEADFDGELNPDAIAFWYGPDIFRDKEGIWRVGEDNLGFVGGPGDLNATREILLRLNPNFKAAVGDIEPERFYADLIERYRERAKPKGGKIVMYAVPPYSDHEDSRLRKIFARYGVEFVTPFTQKKLKVAGDRVDLVSLDGTKERVGFLILDSEHFDLDVRNPLIWRQALLKKARMALNEKMPKKSRGEIVEGLAKAEAAPNDENLRELLLTLRRSGLAAEFEREWKLSVPGLADALLKNIVPSSYSHGVDFVGDKEFYMYVETLIRFYLGQEPLLRNIPTRRLVKTDVSGREVLDVDLIQDILEHRERHVLKPADGRGGDGIFVGPKVKAEEVSKMREAVEKDAANYLDQDFTHLSVLNLQELGDHIVDLRMITDVGPTGEIYVSPIPWGRFLPTSGSGKVNLSDHGKEAVVLVMPAKGRCRKILAEPSPRVPKKRRS